MAKKKDPLPLWRLLENAIQKEALSVLENAYFDPESDFAPKGKAIKTLCIYVSDFVHLFVNCPNDDPPEDHTIALFPGASAEDDEGDPKFQSLIRLDKDIRKLGFRDVDPEMALSQLHATALYSRVDIDRLVAHVNDIEPGSIDLANIDRDEFANDAELLLDELWGQGACPVVTASFYYRQALLLESSLREHPKLALAKKARVWCAIHDSAEKEWPRLRKLATQYSGKGLSPYLRRIGVL